MFSHVMLGVSDFERALAFYQPLLALLQLKLRFVDDSRPWAAWQPLGAERPLLLIGAPYNGEPHEAGNGQMVALQAASRAQVDAAYALALSLGGRCAGAPGLRAHYHADYYGAYFYDPDGNKLCVVCHQPQ